ncbi:peptidoglycan -binding protein [Methyloraptor flagellatus]|uniref:Peptidoglycan -binding protein n=1 Tax=Methyloraptor flagellatus TaxID=3162530 RepID=A0AAU7XA46_9HYPH
MAMSRARRRDTRIDYWPGFVDAMATLLLVIIFLLSVFMLSQFFLSREITGKESALNKLNQQIAQLTELLALERAGKRDVEEQVTALESSLAGAKSESTRLQGIVDARNADAAKEGGQAASLAGQLDSEKRLSQQALAQVELLNQQISALRRQIAALETALDASESRDRESQTKIADLGKRLNVALAQRVQELQKYRSDFFGRLKEILGNRTDIRVVGDRFVFQSEVLFPVGADQINDAGRAELDKLAGAVLDLEKEIPPEVNWTLRVDGHTDARPVSGTGRFKSNWELSAARAISVVRYLIDRGVPPKHLVAAGFGEFQPLEEGTSDEVLNKNRRIEIRLTDR